MAEQLGIWPAFWALGGDFRATHQNWPTVGELDILESPNGELKTWSTIHCGVSPGGPCNEFDGVGGYQDGFTRGEFHVLSVDVNREGGTWETDVISFALDGAETVAVTGAQVADQVAWEGMAHTSKFLLFDVAVGGSMPNNIAGTTTPNEATIGGAGGAMEVEYVAVYSS